MLSEFSTTKNRTLTKICILKLSINMNNQVIIPDLLAHSLPLVTGELSARLHSLCRSVAVTRAA